MQPAAVLTEAEQNTQQRGDVADDVFLQRRIAVHRSIEAACGNQNFPAAAPDLQLNTLILFQSTWHRPSTCS